MQQKSCSHHGIEFRAASAGTGRARAPAILLAAAILLAVPFALPAMAQTAAQIESVAAESIRRLDIQPDLPKKPDDADDGWELNLPYVKFSTWMLWLALALGLGITLWSVRDQIPIWRMRRADDWNGQGAAAGTSAQASLAAASANADELARLGRYMEAIHILLLRSLAEMRQRMDARFADSLTSREILRAVQLPGDGRAALQDIVARVERSYFGEHPAAASDYAACRASFDRFVDALQDGRRR